MLTVPDKYHDELSFIDSKVNLVKDFDVKQKPTFDQVQLLCLVRDGSFYLKEFLRHHRELGVLQFIFLDNGSTDQTLDILKSQNDVKVLYSELPYKKYWHLFKRYLFEVHGKGFWNLVIDIDEFYMPPLINQLGLIIQYNNFFGYNTVVAQMVDLIPNNSITEQKNDIDYVETHIYYSAKGRRNQNYENILLQKNNVSNPSIKFHLGGWRDKEFGVGDIMLTKHPLVKGDGVVRYTHDHFVENANVADFTAILRHYKFRAGFEAYVEQSVNEENHFDNSREYKAYQKKLADNKVLNLYQKGMERIDDENSLFKNFLLVVSPSYLYFFEELENQTSQITKEIRHDMLVAQKKKLNNERSTINNLKDKHNQEIEKIKNSWSWKIGHRITRVFAPIFEFFNRD